MTELCEGGDLAHFLDKLREAPDKDMMSEELVLEWSAQLASALKFIHSLNILHRDLKTKNIFITKGVAKLGDFGIAKVLDGTHDHSNTFAGTPFYMSPEALGKTQYADKADVWSLGCIIFEMSTLKQAFVGATLMVVMCAILDGPLPQLPEKYNQQLRMLVASMLVRNPTERLSAGEVLLSPALEGFPKTRVRDLTLDSAPRIGKKQEINREREEVLSKIRGQQDRHSASRGKGGGGGGGAANGSSLASSTEKLPPWILEHPEVFPDGKAPTETVLSRKSDGGGSTGSGSNASGGGSSGRVSGEEGGSESDGSDAYTTASESAGESDDEFEDAESYRRPSQTIVAADGVGHDGGGDDGGGAGLAVVRQVSDESYLASMMLQNAAVSARHGGNLDSETAAQAMSYFAAMQGSAAAPNAAADVSSADELIMRRASGIDAASISGEGDFAAATAAGGSSSLRSSMGGARASLSNSGIPSKAALQSRRLSGVLLEAQEVLQLESLGRGGHPDAHRQETELRGLIQSHRERNGTSSGSGAVATDTKGAVATDTKGAVATDTKGAVATDTKCGIEHALSSSSDASSSDGGSVLSRLGRKKHSLRFNRGKMTEREKTSLLRRRSSHRIDSPEDGYWHVPYYPSIFFTGRINELQQIRSALTGGKSSTTARFGISQHGGSGKTQLMLRYAWEDRQSYPGGIYLIESDSPERLQQSILEFAEQLGVADKIKAKTTPRAVGTIISEALMDIQGPWLLCVDNADESDVLNLLSHVYFPPSRDISHGHLIVTSRSGDSKHWSELGIGEPLVLEMMPLSDAAICLFRCSTGKWRESSNEILQEISQKSDEEIDALFALVGPDEGGLDGLPLALEQAGAYILRTKRRFSDYRSFLERQSLKLLDKEKAAKKRDDDTDSAQRSVASTWAINVEGLSHIVQQVLTTIACFHPHRIPEELLLRLVKVFSGVDHSGNVDFEALDAGSAASDDLSDDDVQYNFDEWVIEELVSKYSILTITGAKRMDGISEHTRGSRFFSLQRVMRMVIQSRENEAGLIAAGTRALAAIYLHCKTRAYRTVVDAHRMERFKMHELSAHARSVIGHLDLLPLSAEASRLLGVVQKAEGLLDQFQGRYSKAIEYYQRALALFGKVYGEEGDHDEVASTLCQLGNVLSSNGDYKAASVRCEDGLAMFSRLHPDGQDDAGTAAALHRAATIQERLGDKAAALERYEKSLEMNRRIHGADADANEIAATLYRIGNILEAKDDLQRALEHYLESLHMKRRIYDDDEPRPDIAYALASIGSVLFRQGAHTRAQEYFAGALDMRKRIYGLEADHSSISAGYQALGKVHMANGNFEGAQEEYLKALSMRKRIYGEDSQHPELIESVECYDQAEQASLASSGW